MKQPITTFNALVKEMLIREGKRKQVNRAQMIETLSELSRLCNEQPGAIAVLIKNGQKKK